ncbi:MAG: hypothetical protein HOI47_15215 [Candidatus Scalindua sp.]|jgi:FtsZ-interacting cell division protein ZipA|nr:hypothetical protein [Candidatus Scalindua sp.]MBT6227993.1 hypothetical protein [Candidatus Scalindua sp.]MBT7210269.1 hypothetical protein [Candidatus Scalindua sp.]
MEQLVWAIIMIAILIFTALKKRARSRPDTNIDRASKTEQKTRREPDRLGRYMEELLGIDREETKPQIRRERKTPKPLHKKVTPRVKAEIEKDVDQFESPLAKKHSEKRTSPLPEKKGSYYAKFPWSGLSKQDLSNAIILSEIIGPPISKRKSHRLF